MICARIYTENNNLITLFCALKSFDNSITSNGTVIRTTS